MNTQNEANRKALNYATSALFKLDEMGCTVHCVVVRNGEPVLLINRPATPLPNSSMTTRVDPRGVYHLGTAKLCGCQVEWSDHFVERRAS